MFRPLASKGIGVYGLALKGTYVLGVYYGLREEHIGIRRVFYFDRVAGDF
jgi:hypothetical protein